MISAFTFCHNGIEGGYPFVEAIQAVRGWVDEVVVVDMQSTDGTREVLQRMGVTILDGEWFAGSECLTKAHAMNVYCKGDTIVHFEADEVYSPGLMKQIHMLLENSNHKNFSVWRMQISQNFQRVRWYPHLVHRIFPKGIATKVGHTTNIADRALPIPNYFGLLWDITYNFRDNIMARCKNNAFIHGGEPNYLFAPLHINEPYHFTETQLMAYLEEPHWQWCTTPFNIPEILKKHVGKTTYKVTV